MAKDLLGWAQTVRIRVSPFPETSEELIQAARTHVNRGHLTRNAIQAFLRHEYTNYDALCIEIKARYKREGGCRYTGAIRHHRDHLTRQPRDLSDERDRTAHAILKTRINKIITAYLYSLQGKPAHEKITIRPR